MFLVLLANHKVNTVGVKIRAEFSLTLSQNIPINIHVRPWSQVAIIMDSVLESPPLNCEANKYSLIMQTRMILHILLVAKFVTIDDLNQFLNHALAAG